MFGKANNPVRLARLLMQRAPFIVRQLYNENYAVKKGGNSSSHHLAHRDINNLQDWSQSAHGWTQDGNYDRWCPWVGQSALAYFQSLSENVVGPSYNPQLYMATTSWSYSLATRYFFG